MQAYFEPEQAFSINMPQPVFEIPIAYKKRHVLYGSTYHFMKDLGKWSLKHVRGKSCFSESLYETTHKYYFIGNVRKVLLLFYLVPVSGRFHLLWVSKFFFISTNMKKWYRKNNYLKASSLHKISTTISNILIFHLLKVKWTTSYN